LALLLTVGGSGCNSLDDSQKHTADLQIQATNQDLQTKTAAAQTELSVRQRFFQGVSGTYEGQITKAEGASKNISTRLIISATVPKYSSDRNRSLDEINSDLKLLSLNVQVVQWDLDTGATWGCVFMNQPPDIEQGNLGLMDTVCPVTYSIWLMPAGSNNGGAAGASVSGNSSAIAQSLISDQMTVAPALAVEMDPTKEKEIYRFTVKRVDR
jgi:hypothetical protein